RLRPQARQSSEQILRARTLELSGRAWTRRIGESAREHCRTAFVGLAHQQRSGRGELVRGRDLRHAQRPAVAVRASAQVDERGNARDADCNSGDAIAPRASKAIDDEHANLDATPVAQALLDAA